MSAARQYKIREVDKSDFTTPLKKAKEFYQTMYQAQKSENWNAAGLNAVHCVISLIDSILVKYLGVRSAGEDHLSAVDLLASSVKIENIAQKGQLAMRVIAKKNLIAYEMRAFTRNEALDIIKQVERFYEWALDKL